jgi:hypothetical protein
MQSGHSTAQATRETIRYPHEEEMGKADDVQARPVDESGSKKVVVVINAPAGEAVPEKQIADIERVLSDSGFAPRMEFQEELCVPRAQKATGRTEYAVLGALHVHLDYGLFRRLVKRIERAPNDTDSGCPGYAAGKHGAVLKAGRNKEINWAGAIENRTAFDGKSIPIVRISNCSFPRFLQHRPQGGVGFDSEEFGVVEHAIGVKDVKTDVSADVDKPVGAMDQAGKIGQLPVFMLILFELQAMEPGEGIDGIRRVPDYVGHSSSIWTV